MEKEKFVALVSFVFCVCLIVGLSIACGENSPKKPAAITGKVGETLKSDNFEITVTSITSSKTIGGGFVTEKAGEGAIFVIVNYKSKNITSKPISSFSLPRVILIDPDNTVYEKASGASSMYKASGGIDTKVLSDLNPGITQRDANAFEIANENWKKSGWKVRIKADKNIDVIAK